MKTILTLILGLCMSGFALATADTVVVELTNRSKIVIYTEDRDELKDLENYDLNKMIKDLNTALGSGKVERIEFQDENGKRYQKDTTIILGESSRKSSIKIGNVEILVDAEDWDAEEDDEDEDDSWYDRNRRWSDRNDNHSALNRTTDHFNIDIGLSNWLEDGSFPDADNAPYSLKPWGSWYFGINSLFKTWVSGPMFLEWGFGASWQNYSLQNTDLMFEKGATNLELNPTPLTYKTEKSRLSVPYLNVSFVPLLDFSKGKKKVKNYDNGSVTFRTYHREGIRFGAGGFAGYRVGGNTKLKYVENGDEQKDRNSGSYYLTNVRYGLRGQFGFKGFDLFINYDLNEVFTNGPSSGGLHAMSFGITL